MKTEEIRAMSTGEMDRKLKELREEHAKLSFQHLIRPLEDTSRLKKIKKDVARIETIKRDSAN